MFQVLLSACNGGASGGPEAAIRAAYAALLSANAVSDVSTTSGGGAVQISARIADYGTVVECRSMSAVSVSVVRNGLADPSLSGLQCPFIRELVGDFLLSSWSYTSTPAIAGAITSVTTLLPDPIVYFHNGIAELTWGAWLPSIKGYKVYLTARSVGSTVVWANSFDSQLSLAALPASASVQYQWVAANADGSKLFTSKPVATVSSTIENLNYVGIPVVGSLDNPENARDTVIGSAGFGSETGLADYASLGLGALFSGRDFRDVRIADFNGDGLNDVISNVYGAGCTLIGINQGNGQFQFSTPLREDGTCIGGHGETMVLGDFNEDGLIDVFIPTYERWDLLINQGKGVFKDVAVERGIDFPGYLPTAEGAAAVDFDLDGHVDIVAGCEILLNDGTAHFRRVPNVYGVNRVLDEGLFVGDVDNDGYFDIVKNDPFTGPRVFWGGRSSKARNRLAFDASTPLLGGGSVLNGSNGIGVGALMGNNILDIVVAGGNPKGSAPVICMQPSLRVFNCVDSGWTVNSNSLQDLLLVSDIDGSGSKGLVARYDPPGGSVLAIVPAFAPLPLFRFQFDVRDIHQLRTLYGRAVRVLCVKTGEQLGLFAIDGGNGYMSQGAYTVSTSSDTCDQVQVQVYAPSGPQLFGPYKAGSYLISLH